MGEGFLKIRFVSIPKKYGGLFEKLESQDDHVWIQLDCLRGAGRGGGLPHRGSTFWEVLLGNLLESPYTVGKSTRQKIYSNVCTVVYF